MKKILFPALALLAGSAIILLSLELLFRISPGLVYNYNPFKFRSPKLSRLDDFTFLQPSVLLGYEHFPNFGSYGWVGKINSHGLIGREYPRLKGKGVFRILVLGDSIAEQGWSCDFLEDNLNHDARLHKKYKQFEIWNAGVTSYDVRRYSLVLQHKGLKYNPDMVVIFFCLNDFNPNLCLYYKTQQGAAEYYFPISEIAKYCSVDPWLMRHSYLYRFVILRLNNYLSAGKNNPDCLKSNGRFYLHKIKDTCVRNDIPLVAVIFPYLKPLNEYSDGQKYEYRALRDVVADLRIDCLDLYPCLSDKNLPSLRISKDDDIHPGQEGHRLIAKIIYDYLVKGFFKKDSL